MARSSPGLLNIMKYTISILVAASLVYGQQAVGSHTIFVLRNVELNYVDCSNTSSAVVSTTVCYRLRTLTHKGTDGLRLSRRRHDMRFRVCLHQAERL